MCCEHIWEEGNWQQQESPDCQGLPDDPGIVKTHIDLEAWAAALHTAATQDRFGHREIPNQFNRAADDSSPGVYSAERMAVIVDTWQRNQAPASSP
jgi:hypothetical protein